MEQNTLTIGQLAKVSHVNVETVRFYERKGLIVQPQKKGFFRRYSSDYITRIKFIKRSQELGFTLNETQELLELSLKDQARCSDVLTKSEKKITEIDNKITDLMKIKKSLAQLSECCEDTSILLKECPVLDCFWEEK